MFINVHFGVFVFICTLIRVCVCKFDWSVLNIDIVTSVLIGQNELICSIAPITCSFLEDIVSDTQNNRFSSEY